MKKTTENIGEVTYYVDYNFVDTKWGRRCMNIYNCKTREEAEQFVRDNNINDAVIGSQTRIQ